MAACAALVLVAAPCVAFTPGLAHRGTRLRVAPSLGYAGCQSSRTRRAVEPPRGCAARRAGCGSAGSGARMGLGGADGIHTMLALAQAAQTLVAAPHTAASWYWGALDEHALAVDSATAAALYVLGKWTSSAIAGTRDPDAARVLANWSVLGVADGACTHCWYGFLQDVADRAGVDHVTESVGMTLTSSLLYSPVYCAGFLVLLSLVEGAGWSGAEQRVRLDWADLFRRSSAVWGPTNLLLFAAVPLNIRTAVSMGIHYVFLVGVALWDAAVRAGRTQSTAAAGPDSGGSPATAHATPELQGLRAATAFRTMEDELGYPEDRVDLPLPGA